MNAGRVEQVGRAEDIYERPATEFVAGFIGVSNIIEGTVESITDQQSMITVGNSKIGAHADTARPGERVRVLIRPEKISIASVPASGSIPGKIEAAIYLGESTQWRVTIETGQTLTVLEQNREPYQAAQARIGQTVSLRWEPESAVILKG
jgi:ABC-type Fe3+/spermidine/putrescine transport system ATPase subunit